MIRPCRASDFDTMFEIINDAAEAYRGKIPADCWHEPYMPKEELEHEIKDGVVFWGYEEAGADGPSTGSGSRVKPRGPSPLLVGIMGIQDVQDITLIRHAYVRTANRGQGIGSELLTFLLAKTTRLTLVGTWKAATWAIRFYEKHGFALVTEKEKDFLLKKYWKIPLRQIETSVVLIDQKWRKKRAEADQTEALK